MVIRGKYELLSYLTKKISHIKPGVLIDGYSVRLADGKIIDDDKPNKHYVCSEKVWEYKIGNHKYLRSMLKEQVDMGLIEEDDFF